MEKQEAPGVIVAWEEALGFLKSARSLVKICGFFLFRPTEAFKQLSDIQGVDIKKRIMRSIVFAVILGYSKLLFDILNLYWLKNFSNKIISSSVLESLPLFSFSSFSSPLFFLRPLLILSVSFVLIALAVKLVLGFNRSLTPVLFVVCYKSASDILYCIPVVGSILAASWSLALIYIGIRQLYRIDTFRSLVTGILMPFLILFFIFLSVGPSLNRMIVSVYPEMENQLMKLNVVSAYSSASSIASGALAYKKELGFYPARLGALKKYAAGVSVDDEDALNPKDGYLYHYSLLDNDHFVLHVVPEKSGVPGVFSFFVDETGIVRIENKDGREIKDINEVGSLVINESAKKG